MYVFFFNGNFKLVTISNIVFDYIFILLCPCGSFLRSKTGSAILNNFRSKQTAHGTQFHNTASNIDIKEYTSTKLDYNSTYKLNIIKYIYRLAF